MKGVFVAALCLLVFIGASSLANNSTTLRIADWVDIPWNPLLRRADLFPWYEWYQFVVDSIWDSLYVWAPNFEKLIPWLADGEPEIDVLEKTVTVHLKHKMHWATNEYFRESIELTSKDVAFTFRSILEFSNVFDPPYSTPYSNRALLDFIDDVVEVDKYTVRFEMNELTPLLSFNGFRIPILPQHQWGPIVEAARAQADPAEFITSFSFFPEEAQPLNHPVGKPIGTGPFIMGSWSDEAFTLIKRLGYTPPVDLIELKGQPHAIGPFIEEIHVQKALTDEERISSYMKGQADAVFLNSGRRYNMEGFLKPFDIPHVINLAGVGAHLNHLNNLFYLAFNFEREPFNDVAFRRACAFLVDRAALIKEVVNGYAQETYSVVSPANAAWYNAAIPTYGESLSRAERITAAVKVLEEAGYTWDTKPLIEDDKLVQKGLGLKLPNGQSLQLFTIITPDSSWDLARQFVGTKLQEWWEDIGILSVAMPLEWDQLIARSFSDANFDVFVLGWGLTVFPHYLYDFFHSGFFERNPMHYRNDEFDLMVDEFIRAIDPARQKELAFRLQEIIAQDLPYITLYSRDVLDLVSDRFEGWVDQIDGIPNRWSLFLIKPAQN